MKVEGVKITWIAPEEQPEQQERLGFVPVCWYGINMTVGMERNEIGCIARVIGTPKLDHGLWVTPIKVSERIFIVEPEMKGHA